MNGWLLDTNVVSELRKPNPRVEVRRWMEGRPLSTLFLSRITLAEVKFGIDSTADVNFRRDLQRWLNVDLRQRYAGRILEIDDPVLTEWMRMVARGRRMNHTFPQPDLFIAATAAVHGLIIATRNAVEYRKAGVPVVNPWTDPAP